MADNQQPAQAPAPNPNPTPAQNVDVNALATRVAQLERDLNLVNRKLEAANLTTVNAMPVQQTQPATSTQTGQPNPNVGADGRPLGNNPPVQTPSPAPAPNTQAQQAPNTGAGDTGNK